MNNQTSSLEFSHFPVMLNEVLKISSPSTRKKFIDCTFGGGGYSKEILKFSKTKVLANFKISFEYPPPPKVQSIKFPPTEGKDILITSFNITGKWENSSDEV